LSWEGFPLASGAIYAVITVAWAFFWIPFGPGYYGVPWHSVLFRTVIIVWAPAHALAALPLIRRARRHGRPFWLEAVCMLISLWCLVSMAGWMSTAVPGLTR